MKHFINEERLSLEMKNIHELRAVGKRAGVKAVTTLNKSQLIDQILEIRFGEPKKVSFETRGRPSKKVPKEYVYGSYPTFDYTKTMAAAFKDKYLVDSNGSVSGVLEMHSDGFGILHVKGLLVSNDDIYVPQKLITNYMLREGDLLSVKIQAVGSGSVDAASEVLSINGMSPNEIKSRPNFFEVVPVYPKERFELEGSSGISMIDLISPIGKGQRALVVGGRTSGKSELLLNIALGIKNNSPNSYVIPILLSKTIDEVLETGNRFNDYFSYTTFDKDCDYTIRTVSLSIARAIRMAELGKDSVVLIDDLNSVLKSFEECLKRSSSNGNKTAIYQVKSIFGLGTCTNNVGSLTIIAAVDDSFDEGKRLLDEIYQLSNMQIILNSDIANWQVFPPIDAIASKTKKGAVLLSDTEKQISSKIRSTILRETNRENQVKILSKLINCKNKTEILSLIK